MDDKNDGQLGRRLRVYRRSRNAGTANKLGTIGRIFAALFASGILFLAAGPVSAGPFLPNKGAVKAPTGARAICATYDWACARSGQARVPSLEQVSAVSRRVNRATRTVSDESQYRRADHWTLPSSLGGDCEDFALLKKRELVRMGYSPETLLLTTVLDTGGNSHAVLIARTQKGDFVIDNLRDSVRPWNKTGYTFLRMQDPNAPSRWIRLNVKG